MSFQEIKEWVEKHERHLSSAALVFGFIVDNLTLQRIDLLFENLVLASYLFIAALAIAIINLYEGETLRGKFFGWLYTWMPIVMQFAFGALFSGFFVFYSRSASLATSWPFLIVLLGLLIGNEFFKKRYLWLSFQMSIFFVAVFSFLIFFLPVLLKTINAWVFVLSGVVSLIIVLLFFRALSYAIPHHTQKGKTMLYWSIGGLFVLINILYFTNIIPPIPLALKDAGVYHSVSRSGAGYTVLTEDHPWYRALFPYDTIHTLPGQPVYIFSAIFAPTKIKTQVFHHWQYYDEGKSEWVSKSRVSFPIVGGRDGGYRGYSLRPSVLPGWWRVDIETPRGQLIGRVKFWVEHVGQKPLLKTEVY